MTVPPEAPTIRFDRPVIADRVTRLRPERLDTGHREQRSDLSVIGPLAVIVLALTISTLVLDDPSARATAAGLAALGLVAAVIVMLLGKRPSRGKHLVG